MAEPSEIDRMIAEKVMGYVPEKWMACTHECREGCARVECDDCEYEERSGWKRLDGLTVHSVPHYSRDIGSAWEVVDKMTEDGFGVRIQQFEHANQQAVEFYCSHGPCERHGHKRDDCGHGGSAQETDNMPKAICRAALAALS